MADAAKNKVYIDIHQNFVKTDIPYVDPKTGKMESFNAVTMPKGTVVDGHDVSYYEFTPLYINPSKYLGEDYRTIPLLADREVWLKRDQLDDDGNAIRDEEGRKQKDVVKVMPAELKRALDQNRKQFFDRLGDRADRAREESETLGAADRRQTESQVI